MKILYDFKMLKEKSHMFGIRSANSFSEAIDFSHNFIGLSIKEGDLKNATNHICEIK